jgi:hypothetical protein
VLPLLDCSRMEVTVFIIHEQQRYQLLQLENRHLVGEVQVKMYTYEMFLHAPRPRVA